MVKGNKLSSKLKQSSSSMKFADLLVKSVLIGLVVLMILLGLLSLLVNASDVAVSVVDMACILVVIIACFVSGFCAAKKKHEDGMLLGALCGLTIYTLMLGASLLYDPAVNTLALIKLVICVLSGCIGGILGVNVRKGHK